MNPNRSRVLSLLTVLLLASSPAAVAGDEGWAVYGGIYDTAGDDQPVEVGIEHRWPRLGWPKLAPYLNLRPAAGLAGTDDGNAWIYGGLRLDVGLGKRWVVAPQFSISLYEDGGGKDLGGFLEFRSGLEVAYRFSKGQRLGVLFYHLSNADIYDRNPGSNSLVLIWGFGR